MLTSPFYRRGGEKNGEKYYDIIYLATWRESWREKTKNVINKDNVIYPDKVRLNFYHYSFVKDI